MSRSLKHNSAVAVGMVVAAGPALGYGRAIRCLRLARALERQIPVVLYPLSESCEAFLRETSPRSIIRSSSSDIDSLPPLVITDLREVHGITATIHRQESRHISIHDLGLGQCRSDVVIDGSIARLFPYSMDRSRELYIGPQYMITREPVVRGPISDSVLVTFGSGSTAELAHRISEQLYDVGLQVVATAVGPGCGPMAEAELVRAMSSCRFAISGCGTTLYDLIASGIPTIAVAFDRIQLRTADAFHELGVVLSAGLIQKVTSKKILSHVMEMIENPMLARRQVQAGRILVDGKGLSRVIEIVKKQVIQAVRNKTYMTG